MSALGPHPSGLKPRDTMAVFPQAGPSLSQFTVRCGLKTKEKRVKEDEMVDGIFNRHECEQTPGDSGGQGSPAAVAHEVF